MPNNSLPVYATSLATLVFYMAWDSAVTIVEANSFVDQLNDAASQVSATFSINPDVAIDAFNSPVVFNDYMNTFSRQKKAVHHRTALAAFAAKVHTMARPDQGTSADDSIALVLLDLQSNGVIDSKAGITSIGAIDPVLVIQDAMELEIQNTEHRVSETMVLMEEERQLILHDRGPVPQTEAIGFIPDPTPESESTAIFYQDHNLAPHGTITVSSLQDLYPGARSEQLIAQGRASIVEDPTGSTGRGQVMALTVPANSKVGPGFIMPFPARDEIYISFDIFFNDGNVLPPTTKIFGVYSDLPTNQLSDVTGFGPANKGFSCRLQMQTPEARGYIANGTPSYGAIGSYSYYKAHQTGSNSGKMVIGSYDTQVLNKTDPASASTSVGLIPDKWNNIQYRVRVNTSTSPPTGSVLELWVNGYKSISLIDRVEWTPSGKQYLINKLWVGVYHGGGSSDVLPTDKRYYIDNVTVSENKLLSVPDRSTPWNGT